MSDTRGNTVLGTTIGKHRIVKLLGGGVVGRVFVCRNPDLPPHLDVPVAIKVLRTRYANLGDALMRARPQLEKVQSPHVVAVSDVSVYSNVPYIVMELVDGDSLAVMLARERLRTVDALDLARAACLGLQAAWSQGIAHGDVRPANLLLPGGKVTDAKLVDFMLAAPVEGTDNAPGTPAYMAPELLVGTPPDVLTDLYALGCTLFECLTGRTPFAGAPAAVLQAHVSTPPPSLAAAVPGAPQGLVDLVERLLEKDRAKRVKTYAEALAGIERALQGLSMPAPVQPRVPELDVDIDADFGEDFDDGKTDEIHTAANNLSALREDLSDEFPLLPSGRAVASPLGEDRVFGELPRSDTPLMPMTRSVPPRAVPPTPSPPPARAAPPLQPVAAPQPPPQPPPQPVAAPRAPPPAQPAQLRPQPQPQPRPRPVPPPRVPGADAMVNVVPILPLPSTASAFPVLPLDALTPLPDPEPPAPEPADHTQIDPRIGAKPVPTLDDLGMMLEEVIPTTKRPPKR